MKIYIIYTIITCGFVFGWIATTHYDVKEKVADAYLAGKLEGIKQGRNLIGGEDTTITFGDAIVDFPIDNGEENHDAFWTFAEPSFTHQGMIYSKNNFSRYCIRRE